MSRSWDDMKPYIIDLLPGQYRHLAQMIHSTILVTRHQRNVPDGLEVSPLAAVSRHTAHVLRAVLVLKAMLQLCVTEADTNTEVNIAEIIKLIRRREKTGFYMLFSSISFQCWNRFLPPYNSPWLTCCSPDRSSVVMREAGPVLPCAALLL